VLFAAYSAEDLEQLSFRLSLGHLRTPTQHDLALLELELTAIEYAFPVAAYPHLTPLATLENMAGPKTFAHTASVSVGLPIVSRD
jgi:hypothetical protein